MCNSTVIEVVRPFSKGRGRVKVASRGKSKPMCNNTIIQVVYLFSSEWGDESRFAGKIVRLPWQGGRWDESRFAWKVVRSLAGKKKK